MRPLGYLLPLVAIIALAGCVMVDSELEFDTTGINYRSSGTKLKDSSSNSVSNSASSEGGGKVDASIPVGK